MRSSEPGRRYKLALLGLIALFGVGAHVILEITARFAEQHLDAYLWKQEDYLRLFSPANHEGCGRHRLLIYGPSEAREALLPEELARVLPGSKPYQNALSEATFEDGLVVLDYIERVYGRCAVPEALLLGITPRLIADLSVVNSPLFAGINKYSPKFTLDETQHPPPLVPRSWLDSLGARWALLGRQPVRYQNALFAIASDLVIKAHPPLEEDPRFWRKVRAAKYISRRWPLEGALRYLAESTRWRAIHAWDPERDRDRVTRELHLLLEYTSRHGIELYVVNLPELSGNRVLYLPGHYEAYLEIVRSALGVTPLLDLRTFLADDEFYDASHATWAGGIRVSKRVADFIAEHRQHVVSARVGK